jgi:hypothetical protein
MKDQEVMPALKERGEGEKRIFILGCRYLLVESVALDAGNGYLSLMPSLTLQPCFVKG